MFIGKYSVDSPAPQVKMLKSKDAVRRVPKEATPTLGP